MSAGYGRTVWCVNGYMSGRYVSGRAALIQSLYHRGSTPRGTLQGGDIEDVYGVDLSELVGSIGLEASYAMVPGLLRNEYAKDERVSGVVVTPSIVHDKPGPGLDTLSLDVLITPADASGDFSFTLEVSTLGVVLVGGVQ